MLRRFHVVQIVCLYFLFCLLACRSNIGPTSTGWVSILNNLGSSSSPGAVDLNQDGILDIVFGAGQFEFEATDSGVVALNGLDGSVLWRVSASDQIFTTPRFMDINGDKIEDVFIGGRSAELMAIDGSAGEIIWRYNSIAENLDATTHFYNFYNPQFVGDVNGDGFPDLLVSNGGDVKAQPNDGNRPPGKLMLIDSRTGVLIASATMPDGRETYLSPVVYQLDEETNIIFGSGGETMPGKLYRSDLADLLDGDLSGAEILAESEIKGFIAPPVLADINQDGVLDIVSNSVDGRTIAIDGSTAKQLWSFAMEGTEVYGSLAVGHFNGDKIPDFFAIYGEGQFPRIDRAIQIAFDGADGSILFQDSIGSYHYGSPVAYDINGDQIDEVLYHANLDEQGMIRNVLKVFDFATSEIFNFSQMSYGSDNGSTPLLEDLDADGLLEIIFLHENDPFNLFSQQTKMGVTVKVLNTNIEISQPIRWGAYMGSDGNGIW